MRLIDLTGQKFGRLTVIRRGENIDNYPGWVCQCDCGNITHVRGKFLRSGRTQSCGCLHNELLTIRNTKHDGCGTRLYDTWMNMKSRCHNPNNDRYRFYGGRGIKVCDDWKNDFKVFHDWAISNGYDDSLTIERIDVNGDYCPTNCTWITIEQQQKNKRNTIYVTFNEESITLSKLSELVGINYNTLYYKIITLGLSVDDAIGLQNSIRHDEHIK